MGESVLGCGEVWGCGGANTLFYTSPHTLYNHPTPLPTPFTLTRHLFPHSSNTSPPNPHTHLTRLSTLPHTHFRPPHTLSHFPTPLTPFLHLPQHFPTLTLHASSQPPRFLQHFPMLPYFIIYPMPKFLTFLIYCQISPTIKYR